MKTYKIATNVLISILLFTQTSVFSQTFVNKNSVRFQSNHAATVVGDNGTIFHTTNCGSSWSTQSINITNTLRGSASYDANISFAVGDNGIIIRTTDCGSNWYIQPSPISQNLNDIISIHQTQTLAACGGHGKIIISHDNGENWTDVYSGDTNNLKQIQFVDNNVGFVVGCNSTLLKTTNGGNSWTHIYLNFGTFQFNSLAAASESFITLVGDDDIIMNTIDGGNSWYRPETLAYFVNLNSIVYFNSDYGIVTGDHGLILKTTDGGANWDQAQVVSNNPVQRDLKSVSFSPLNMASVGFFGIIVGDSGATYCSTDLGATWTDFSAIGAGREPASAKQTAVTINQNFPNPFNPSTVISYNLPFDASVSLHVYDMLGKEVKTLVNSNQTAGGYKYVFDGSGLSSGIYFYVLRAQNGNSEFSKTMRMILTK